MTNLFLSFLASVTLAWDPNTENDLAGYNFYFGDKPGTYTNRTTVGNVTTNRVSGLAPGSYYFAVTAYNDAGAESDYSAEVTYNVATNQPVPIPATASKATAISVQWDSEPGKTYIIENNFDPELPFGWVTVATNVTSGATGKWTAVCEQPLQFFRVSRLD
jgi:Tfp pilus assembly protein PilW